MWKKLRISILLIVLIIVAGDAYLTRFRAVSWDETLWVGIYPINADNDPAISSYIEGLSDRNFTDIEEFFSRQAQSAGLSLDQPFKIMFAHPVKELPPPPPGKDANVLEIAWWSLRLRYWAFTNNQATFSPHIRMFVIYHNYEKQARLAHSLGLEKGMIGVVHGYAHRELEGKNNLVIAHEMLHTLGATDKYDPQSGEPVHPQGYADPERAPLYPQQFAELMGGRIPVSQTRSVMPRSLRSAQLGHLTLQEINWAADKM